MVRFSKLDKKKIARAQDQEVYDEDYFAGTTFVGYRCKRCRRVFDLDILEVDHIKPQSRGGSDLPSNLQLLCPPCNKKKGSKVKTTSIKATVKSKRKVARKKSKPLKKKAVKSPIKKKTVIKKRRTTRKMTAKSPAKRKSTTKKSATTRKKKTKSPVKRRSASKKRKTTKRKK